MKPLVAALAAAWALTASAEPVAFGLFGDMPYGGSERTHLPYLIEEMDAEDLAFVVHDGDIKSGASPCSDAVFRDILDVFRASKHPLVFVPGDNEWTDCHRWSNGAYDPLERLARLRQMFFADDYALGKTRLRLERHSAAYPENVRWPAGDALFVGMNLPGSYNNYFGVTRSKGPSAEYVERGKANRAWLASSFALARDRRLAGLVLIVQADPDFEAAAAGRPRTGYAEFLAELRDETLRFPGQVVLVHGDTHRFRIDQPLRDDQGRTVANFTRVETFGSPILGWVKGTADAADPAVFRFEARPYRPQ